MKSERVTNTKMTLAALLSALTIIALTVIAVDAFEYEHTGQCEGCIILDKVRSLD